MQSRRETIGQGLRLIRTTHLQHKVAGALSATRRTAVFDGPQASDKSSRTSALLTTAREGHSGYQF